MAGGKLLRGAAARAQERDRGRNREQDDAQRKRQSREFMPFEGSECIEIVGDRMQHPALGPGAVGQQDCQSRRALSESPAPRMRFAAPSPDRVRHSRALAERSPAGTRPGKQTNRDDIRRAVRESKDFNLKVTRVVRVQTVNGEAAAMPPNQDLRVTRVVWSRGRANCTAARSPLFTTRNSGAAAPPRGARCRRERAGTVRSRTRAPHPRAPAAPPVRGCATQARRLRR
jgi:hypothetical protein